MPFSEFPFDAQNSIGWTWPIIRTPMQSSIVSTATSGKEYRNAKYPFPRWKWKMDMGYMWDDYSYSKYTQNYMFQSLAGFYNSVSGQYNSWLYQDPFDNTAASIPAGYQNANGIYTFTGNGTQKAFQIFKQQQGGPLEPVQYIVSTTQVTVNGTPTGAYTISQPPAVLNLTSAPPSGQVVEWSGVFYYLCRFTADSYDFSHDFNGVYTMKDLEFMSVFA